MLRVTLANLGAHQRRLVSTFAAVLLGVAFLSGVLVQSATLEHKFNVLFDTSSAEVDAAVRNPRQADLGEGETVRPPIPAEVLDRLRDVPGIANAQPTWSGTAVVVGADGKAIGTMGPPQMGLTWHDDPELNAYRLVEGVAPIGTDDVVIDRRTADQGDLRVGDRTQVLTPAPVEVTISGIARFGSQDSAAGSTAALFSIEGARAHLAEPIGAEGAPGVDSIVLTAQPGVDLDAFAADVAEAAGPGTETLTRADFRAENRDDVDGLMNFLRPVLLAFALIALLVASFSIYNTFAIIVAQRTREAALLRAIGASRAQTLRAVLVESFLVGLVASAAGLAAGLGVATGLGAVLAGSGMDMPGGLLLEPATLLACLAIGTVLTVLCALGPAVRASKVTPIEALRDAAIDRSGTSRARVAIGAVTAVAASATIVSATVGSGGMALGALGVGLAVLALVVLGPIVAGPAGRLLGQPLRLRGVTGDLARLNSIRNPRRTASSSSALMIGVAIVALFTVIASSITSTVDDQVNEQFGGDLIVSSTLMVGLDTGIAPTLADLPEVEAAAGLANASVTIDGDPEVIGISDIPEATKLLDVDPRSGDLDDVVGASMAISADAAEDRGWAVGTVVPVGFVDGSSTEVTVRAVYGITDMAGDYLLPTELVTGRGQPIADNVILVSLADGVSLQAGRAAVDGVVGDLPTADLMDRAEFADFIGQQINTVLYLVYGMLALSIVIALMGIANTLSLSTFERTRELGLLRAVGQLRRQTRAMVRLESVVVALYGTVVGLAVGVLGAWVLVTADDSAEITRFDVPVTQLAVVVGLGALAGVLAAIRPASRAARRAPLEAIAAA